jgi:hypothetical protein
LTHIPTKDPASVITREQDTVLKETCTEDKGVMAFEHSPTMQIEIEQAHCPIVRNGGKVQTIWRDCNIINFIVMNAPAEEELSFLDLQASDSPVAACGKEKP